MEIKKVEGGWEYDGVVMTDKQDLLDAIQAEKEDPTPERPVPPAHVLWHPEMGTEDFRYELAQYLMQPGNDLQSLARLMADIRKKGA